MTFPEIQKPTVGGGITVRSFGVGRLVLIIPKSDGQGLKFGSQTELERQIMCDVVALDGGLIPFGGKADNSGRMIEPDTMGVTPSPAWVAENVMISSKSLIRSVEKALPNPAIGRAGAAALGRLWQDPQYRNAWKLSDPTPDDFVKAEAWKAAVQAGQFVNPQPMPIAAAAASQAPAAPPAYSYAPPAQAAPVAAPAVQPPPPGFTAEMWAAMPDAAKQATLAALGAAQAPAAAPASAGW